MLKDDKLVKELIKRDKSKKYVIFQGEENTILIFVNTALLLSGGINIYLLPKTDINIKKVKELAKVAFAKKLTAYFVLYGRNKNLENEIIEKNLYLYDIYSLEDKSSEIFNFGAIKGNKIEYIPNNNEIASKYINLLLNESLDEMAIIFVNKNTRELEVLATPYKIVEFNNIESLEKFIKKEDVPYTKILNEVII